jgi:hypothetical protein
VGLSPSSCQISPANKKGPNQIIRAKSSHGGDRQTLDCPYYLVSALIKPSVLGLPQPDVKS